MHFGKSILGIAAAALLSVASLPAQQIRYTDFGSVANLSLNGSVHQATWANQPVLRLTDGNLGYSNPQASTAWFNLKQPMAKGFTTYFKFQVHNPAGCCAPGDGIAFVIQNSSSTDSTYGATGAGLTALGVGGGGIGYAGIPNSLAIEFDTSQEAWDPTSNHVAAQSCGTATNGPVHNLGVYTIGQNHNVTSCLVNQNPSAINSNVPHIGVTCDSSAVCQDGAVHQAVVEYTAPKNNNPGTLKVWLDPVFIKGTHTPDKNSVPQINIPYTIDGTGELMLDNGAAWVGFTGSQNGQGQVQDVFAWEFTPHQDIIIVQEIKDGGQQTNFTYGGHVYAVTYPQGFVNVNHIQMSVDAMPIDKTTFYNTRLKNTAFSNEQCVTYLETGGSCIVYRVQCFDQNKNRVTCPTEDTPTIFIKTAYYTSDAITTTNADFIKDPTEGQNQWVRLTDVQFQQNQFDPTTSGKGSDFSDFVATFKPHN